MGEYNRRFRLADALDQAEALGNLRRGSPPPEPRGAPSPSPPRPPGLAGRTPPTLGAERTDYLAGVLRALPVSEEGVSESPEEAKAKAEASAKAMSAALDMGEGRVGGQRGGAGGGEGGGGSPPRDPEELDEMVKSVQAVLGGVGEPGGLGEGFVEACLSVLGWSPQVREREPTTRRPECCVKRPGVPWMWNGRGGARKDVVGCGLSVVRWSVPA